MNTLTNIFWVLVALAFMVTLNAASRRANSFEHRRKKALHLPASVR